MSWNEYPGQGHHQHPPHHHHNGGPPPPPWAGSPAPPQPYGYAPQYQQGPPPPPLPQYQSGGYQQGGYVPPTGQQPPSHYYQTGAGYMPPNNDARAYSSYGAVPGRPPTQMQHYGPQMQGQGGQQYQPYFQYSQCTGRRKALCIGINYIGTSQELRGCINDARNVQRFIMQNFGYKADDIVMLTDDAANPRQIPTRANMIQAMQWLVNGAQPNDALFFHYSGHGGQTKDLDGDEDDGYDEVIYPLDYKQSGQIVDDEYSWLMRHALMVRPLPAGCRLTAIFDSCHSGSCLDLPYIYSTEGKIKEPNLLAEAGQGLLSASVNYLRGDSGALLKGLMGIGKTVLSNNSGAADKTKQTRTSPADVIMWSGCKDSQTSADTQEAGKATGAMSFAFIAALTKVPQQSYLQLLNSIRDELRGRYDQKPQLSASHPIDTNLLFIA
ncbi:metacaspase-1 [Tremella mesenterica]|uniref:Metacaspase-1 n=1 Tax=Tremella mesenterica TaxID=5217 RepID=A0A4Q1BSU3_TREME|nr:metacaspase-1 [Tremella mesenterica]